MVKRQQIGTKHSHQTLLDSGLRENTITGMMKAGLLRYDSKADMLFTLSPPSRWPKYWRNKWGQRIPPWRLKQAPWLKMSKAI